MAACADSEGTHIINDKIRQEESAIRVRKTALGTERMVRGSQPEGAEGKGSMSKSMETRRVFQPGRASEPFWEH